MENNPLCYIADKIAGKLAEVTLHLCV